MLQEEKEEDVIKQEGARRMIVAGEHEVAKQTLSELEAAVPAQVRPMAGRVREEGSRVLVGEKGEEEEERSEGG
eukprot:764171-Hanusia_phi.AAC.4